jgi:hypothetical protein
VSELGEASGSKGTKHPRNLFSRILSGSGSSTTYILFMLMFIETPFLSIPNKVRTFFKWMLMLGKLIGNALKRAFVRPDASLLGHDASPTTCSPLI